MVKTRRTFSKELKLSILRQLDAGVSLAQVARENEIHPETIRQWKKRERKYGERAFTGNGSAYTDDARIAELERTIGQQAHEIRLLKKANALLKNLESKSGAKR
jgi:transposase